MINIVWFKRDLRLEDHAALRAAAGRPVLPLYVVEPEYWALPDTAPRQWQFTRGALLDLATRLAELGAPLVIRRGDVVPVLEALHVRHGALALFSHEETGNGWTFARDRAVAAWCRGRGVTWQEFPQFGVRRGLRDRNTWARYHAAHMAAPPLPPPTGLQATDEPPGEIPEQPRPWCGDDGLRRPQPAGRAAALALLDGFCAGRGADYRRGMSSPATAARACSRLSPHLAMGSLSMREALRAVDNALAAPAIPAGNLVSLRSRLHWHCHFIQKLESEPALEHHAAHPAAEAARRPTAPDDPLLEAWATGRTGLPFLDACMRSLIATGWLNFRARAMVQAVASYQLGLDWRASGLRLARLFTDYEPGIHWPQVQMQSGATGINTPRIYNPVKQSLDQDPDGRFIARWVPELANLPPMLRHMPWKGDPVPGYPAPVVDLEAAGRSARARLTALRASPGFEASARQVYARHGSRARRFGQDHPAAERARAAAKSRQAARQGVLDL